VADMITPEFGGIASPENDPAALRPLLERFLRDPAEAERAGAAARAHAEATYAAPVVAKRIEELFGAAIGAG